LASKRAALWTLLKGSGWHDMIETGGGINVFGDVNILDQREYLDQTLFWTPADLENKLQLFKDYFNRQRVHSGLEGRLPDPDAAARTPLDFSSYRWQRHCHRLYQTPIAA
jgi:hypothetical protein